MTSRSPSDRSRTPWHTGPVAGLAAGLVGTAVVTIFGRLLGSQVDAAAMVVMYQPVVLAISSIFGLPQGLLVSLESALAYNWFFIPPLYTLDVAQAGGIISLVVFTLTAVVTSHLAAGFRRQREESNARRRDAELLTALAECALTNVGPGAPGPAVEQAAARALGVRDCRIVLGTTDGEVPSRVAPSPDGFAIPLRVGERLVGVLVAGMADPTAEALWQRPQTIDAVAGLTAVAVDRGRLLAIALDTEALRRSDDLKTALLHGISHELRTPITAITTAAHAVGRVEGDTRALGALIEEQSARLDRLVTNLLDLSRLEADAVRAHLDWCAPEEMVAGALAGAQVEGVAVEMPHEMPLVQADALLCERVLVNLLLNAARHGRPPIVIAAEADDARLHLMVRDAGPGPSPDVAAHVFHPFAAGARTGGTGVGLALSRGFAEAQGGALHLEHAGGETIATLTLPLLPTPVAAP